MGFRASEFVRVAWLLALSAVPAFSQGSWFQNGKITPNGTSQGQGKFGSSLAIWDDWLVAGAPFEDGMGSAYLFELQNGVWTQVEELYPSVIYLEDDFGAAVDLEDGIAAVGAPGFDDDSGKVYFFESGTQSWYEDAWFMLQPSMPDARFGWSVAVAGEEVLVGAPGISRVFIFDCSGGVWSWSGELVPLGIPPAQFGSSVAFDGTRAVVGAPGDRSARVFERSLGIWAETAVLVPDDPTLEDFGASVALHGSEILVGAPATGGSGAAVLFGLDTGGWSQTAELRSATALPESEFGFSVALDTGIAVIGAPSDDDDVLGSAHVFELQGSVWSETAKLDPDVGQGEGTFASSVAVGAGTVFANVGLNDSGVLGYLGAVNFWLKTRAYTNVRKGPGF